MAKIRGEVWVTGPEFEQWLERVKAKPELRLRTDAEIARALGVSARHMLNLKALGAGQTTGLAMAALERGLTPPSRRGELEAAVMEHRNQ